LSETIKSCGNLIIVSGPSGAGKSALVGSVLKLVPGVRFSVSYTTREPRVTETDGLEYFFVDRPEFESLIRSGSFLEWAEVHGNLYGTSKAFVEDLMMQGYDVVLDIDVQGADIIRKKRPDAIGVFIMPPSFDVLKSRLVHRSLDAETVVEQRLKRACNEISHYTEYEYLIVNEDLGSAIRELESIIVGARCRTTARTKSVKSILATFGGLDAEGS